MTNEARRGVPRARATGAAPPRGLERLTDLPIALAVAGVGSLLGASGPRAAYRFAAMGGRIWNRLAGSRRRIALRNLEIAFGDELGPARRERIARESCAHALATAVGVFLRRREDAAGGLARVFEVDPVVERLLGEPHPRGLVVLSAHLGDWEMLQHALALRGCPVAAVARLIHNPHLDRLVTRLRSARGASVIPKAGALRALRRILLSGGAAGLMPDQAAPPGEPCYPFFGASAATYFQYARLLARLEPDVYLVICARDGLRFRFRLEGRELSGALRGPGDEEERAARLVSTYLSALEEAVRARPEQYLWMHRRWKNRPAGAPDLYRALGAPLDRRVLEVDPAAAAYNGVQALRAAVTAPPGH